MAKQTVLNRVPWGIIEQVVHPKGRRLPSEKGLFPITDHDAKYRPWTSPRTPEKENLLQLVRKRHQEGKISPQRMGNLLNGDYREFQGSATVDSDYSVCRGCDTVCRTKMARDLHRNSCKLTILDAIKLLGRDGLCAVCDKRTSTRMWGVPLCDTNCQTVWRYFTPKAFREARRLVLNQRKEPANAELQITTHT
jgi:hypothetical protein